MYSAGVNGISFFQVISRFLSSWIPHEGQKTITTRPLDLLTNMKNNKNNFIAEMAFFFFLNVCMKQERMGSINT